MDFDAHFGDGTVELVFASREPEQLLRDAGGTSPQHAVYSSTKAKAEFGLDPQGRGAMVNFASPPVSVRCVRE
jgi:acetoin utilization deacetylase AcuC-like enzyme